MWLRNGWTRLSLLAVVVALVAACSGGSRPESVPVAPVVADRPALAPIATVTLKSGSGFVPATALPTFTPVPTRKPALLPAVTVVAAPTTVSPSGSADVVQAATTDGPTPTVPRFACVVEYRRWLVQNGRGGSAPELTEGLEDFRALYPYCGRGRFEPVFSIGRVCDDENRVGGATVMGHLSRGRDYNHNVRLGPTSVSSWGHMLIHFERLPNVAAGGCWYYDPDAGRWHEEVVGGRESATATAAPADARNDDVAGGYEVCDAELRFRIEELTGPYDYEMLNDLILQVGTGLSECSVGWYPVVGEAAVSADCPDGVSGPDEFGNAVVHWEEAPPSGGSCWVFHAEERAWDDR